MSNNQGSHEQPKAENGILNGNQKHSDNKGRLALSPSPDPGKRNIGSIIQEQVYANPSGSPARPAVVPRQTDSLAIRQKFEQFRRSQLGNRISLAASSLGGPSSHEGAGLINHDRNLLVRHDFDVGTGALPGEMNNSQSILAEQFGKNREPYYGNVPEDGSPPTIIDTDEFDELDGADEFQGSPGDGQAGRVRFAKDGKGNLKKRRTSKSPGEADIRNRRITVNKNVIRSVRLSFTNTGRQKVVIYQEKRGGMNKKIKQLLANATYQVVGAFKFDKYIIKQLENTDLDQSDQDRIKKETEILKITVNRNMHVMIPASSAIVPQEGDDKKDPAKTTVWFTNNIKQEAYIVSEDSQQIIKPQQTVSIDTIVGQKHTVVNQAKGHIFTCFGSEKEQFLQINEEKMTHCRGYDNQKLTIYKVYRHMPSQPATVVTQEILGLAEENFFKENVIQRYKKSQPTFFVIDTQPRVAMVTVDKNLLYWNQIKNSVCQLNLVDENLILPFISLEKDLKTQEQLSCLCPSKDQGKTYVLGFLDGSVKILSTVDFKEIAHLAYPETQKPDQGSAQKARIEVNCICTDQNLIVIVHESGLLRVYENGSEKKEGEVFSNKLFEKQYDSPVKTVKITNDSRFVVVFCEDRGESIVQNEEEHIEFLDVFDFSVPKHPEEIGRIPLNLDDNKMFAEKPEKMFKLKDDNQTMMLRSVDMMGIQEVSMDTCRLSDSFDEMHKKPILDFILMQDQQTLITVARDRMIKVWNYPRKLLVESRDDHESAVTCITLSKDEQFLFSGDDYGEIIVWMTPSWLKLCKLKQDYLSSLSFDQLHISDDNMMLTAFDRVGVIVYWQLIDSGTEQGSSSMKISSHNLRQAVMTNDKNYFVGVTDSLVKLWNLRTDSVKRLCSGVEERSDQNIVKFTRNSRYLFFNRDDKSITKWDAEQNKELYTIPMPQQTNLQCFELDNDDKYLFVATQNSWLLVLSQNEEYEDYQLVAKLSEMDDSYLYMQILLSHDQKWLLLMDDDDNLTLIDVQDKTRPELIYDQYNMDIDSISAILFIQDNSNLVLIASLNTENLIIFDVVNQEIKNNVIKGHTYPPLFCNYLNRSVNQLVTQSRQEIIFWRVSTSTPLQNSKSCDVLLTQEFIMPSRTFKTVLCPGQNIIALIQNSKIRFLNYKFIQELQLEYGQSIDQKKNTFQAQNIWLNLAASLTFRERDHSLKHLNDALIGQPLKIKGPLDLLFPRIVEQIQSVHNFNDQVKYVKAVKDNMIQPFNISLLHFFSQENNGQCVQKCFELGLKYTRDQFNQTPLGYAHKNAAIDATFNIVNYLQEDSDAQEQMYMAELCALIRDSPSNLDKFFENTISLVQENIPRQGIIKDCVRGPHAVRFFMSQNPELEEQEFKDHFLFKKAKFKPSSWTRLKNYYLYGNEESQNVGQNIIMKRLNIKYDFTVGSQASLDFHQALSETKDEDCFTTEAIQIILKYKWDQFNAQKYYQITIQLLYILTIAAHAYLETDPANREANNQIYTILSLCCFCVIFFVHEFMRFVGLWALSGFHFTLLLPFYYPIILAIYIGMSTNFPGNKSLRDLLSLLNLVSWYKGITRLKYFEQSRIFIHLLEMVIYDVITFLKIFVYAMLMFASTFFILLMDQLQKKAEETEKIEDSSQPSETEASSKESQQNFLKAFIGQIYYVYQVVYGAFELTNENSLWLNILIIATSCFLNIIMLNIVIAIMSDTYAQVMSNVHQYDGREQNSMILKHELQMFWKRDGVQQAAGDFINKVTCGRTRSCKCCCRRGKKREDGSNDQIELAQTERTESPSQNQPKTTPGGENNQNNTTHMEDPIANHSHDLEDVSSKNITYLYWLQYQIDQSANEGISDPAVIAIEHAQKDLKDQIEMIKQQQNRQQEAVNDLQRQLMLKFSDAKRRQMGMEENVTYMMQILQKQFGEQQPSQLRRKRDMFQRQFF